MRRRHIAYAAAAALLASLVAGCSADMGDPQKDEASGTGSISLSISDPSGSRTILPSGVTGPAPSAYLVGGTGPDGEDLTRGKATAAGSELATVSWKDPFGGDAERTWFVTDKTALDVKGVHQGEWDLRVVSMYDALGEDRTFAEGASRIAKGQTVKRLSAADASATVALDRLVRGDEGGALPDGQTARISLTWDKDQVETPVLTVKAKYQGDGTKDSAAATFAEWFSLGLSSGNNTGEKEFTTKALPAGAYTVLASITEKKADGTYDTLAGTADVVRILENRQSAGTIPLTIGLVTNEYTLALKDMTMRPIEGEIIVSGSSAVWYPDEDSFNALASTGLITVPDGKTYGTMTKDEIDQVLDASNLTYLWTIDGQGTVEGGQQVEAAGNNVSWSGVATGEAALQVVVGSGLLGSLGSTGVTITPGMIGFDWPENVGKATAEAETKAFVGYRKIGAGKAIDAAATVASLVSFPYIGSWDDLEPVYVPVDELFDAPDESTPVFSDGTLSGNAKDHQWAGITVLGIPKDAVTVNIAMGSCDKIGKIHLPEETKNITRLNCYSASEVNFGNVQKIATADSLYLPNLKDADFTSLVSTADAPVGFLTAAPLRSLSHVYLGQNVTAIAAGSFTPGPDTYLTVEAPWVESFAGSTVNSTFTQMWKGLSLDMPRLTAGGPSFLSSVKGADSVDLSGLSSLGDGSFQDSTFKRLSLDSITALTAAAFMYVSVDDLELPNLTEAVASSPVFMGLQAKKFFAPKLAKVNLAFMNATLGDANLRGLKDVGSNSFSGAKIDKLNMDGLEAITGSSNFSGLTVQGELDLPSLKTVASGNFSGITAASASMPLLESVGDSFLSGAQIGTSVTFGSLKQAGEEFLAGSSITEIGLPKLEAINGAGFLAETKVADLYLPASLTTVCSGAVGYSWTEDQTIHVPFAEGKLPSGWASDWLAKSCKAKVVYGTVDGLHRVN